ncbi:MAG: hypothetical protein ACTSU5_04835 [Promethearchaeota archaeon]
MAPRDRLYRKKGVEPLDAGQRYERSVLLEKIKDANFWKQSVFKLLEGRKLTAEQVQQELLEKNFRRELSLESVEKTLRSLAELGYLRCEDESAPPEKCEFTWNCL